MRRISLWVLLVSALVLETVSAQQPLPRVRRHEGAGAIALSFGSPVATIGDVDLDLIDDYAVGSPDESLGGPQQQARGVVRVYSGATGAVIHTLTGSFNLDHFGWSIGGGGDIDADGVPDLIVGLPLGQNTASTGHVRTYSGLTGNLIWAKVLGPLDGYRVANAGDVDGDGFADVVTSTGTFNLPAPPVPTHVLVLSGLNSNVVLTIPGLSVGASAADSFGLSLAGGKDFNSDSVDDIVVGYASYGGIGGQTGAVMIFSGATGALLMTMAGTPVYSFLGGSVALAGDVNGDGIEDVVAGGAGNGSVNIPGFVRVYSGAGGFALHTAIGPIVSDGFGGTVAGGVDLDGDGVPDFATSTPSTNPTGPAVPTAYARGAMRAFSGATGQSIGVIAGLAPGSNMGGWLAMLHDSNGDGFGEILVGSPSDDTPLLTNCGSVELVQVIGFSGYGLGNSSLQLTFVTGLTPALSNGALLATGATPSGAGIIAADLLPGNTTVGSPPVPVWVGQSPALLLHPVTYDASGAWSVAFDLRSLPLAGTVIFTQAFELNPAGVYASGGLQLLFGY